VDYEAIGRTASEKFSEIFDWAGLHVRELITSVYPPDTRILDVGAGQGKYRVLLTEYEYVYAVEVFEPYVAQNKLLDLYHRVYTQDVREFAHAYGYSLLTGMVVIMGDVLEHLTRAEAQDVLGQFQRYVQEIIVVVPYEYPQGEEDGNVHQEHLQDDLTLDIMAKAYPQLTLVDVELRDGKPFKGIYRWRR